MARLPVSAYRLADETAILLRAIKESRPREFLTYEELIAELVRFYLAHQRTLSAEVTRWMAAHPSAPRSPPAPGDEEVPPR